MNAAVADTFDARYDTTDMALQDTVLSPHFYTTDFDALDRIDVEPIRAEWDRLMAEFEADNNRGHFKRTDEWDDVDLASYSPELQKELVDFLVSSVTSEFSGCVLYAETKKRVGNQDIKRLFRFMADRKSVV